MTYKHKQLSTKLVGADFSAPRASFLSLLPACAERSRSIEVSLYHHVKSSKCHHVKMSNRQIVKFSNPQIINRMKKIFLSLILAISFIPFSSAQEWQWAKRFGGSNGPFGLNNYPHHLVLDDYGNAYMYGTYGGGTEFNGENLQLFADYNCGSFVAKFDCNGNVVWHKAIARTQNENCNAQYMVLKDNRLYLQGTVHMQPYEPIWFLDTVVSGSSLSYHYPDNTFPWISNNYYTYMMEFDLDGNMLDYDLFALYKEDFYSYDGIYTGKRTYYLFDQYGDISKPVPFAIDNQHNYYLLARMKCDGMQDSLGNFIPQKMVFKHNGEDITDTIMPEESKYIYRLLKFDRNFNMQCNKQLVVNISDTACAGFEMYFSDMSLDSENNMYISGHAILRYKSGVEPAVPVDLELAENKHIYFYNTEQPTPQEGLPVLLESFVMKINSECEVLWVSHSRNHGKAAGCEFYSMLLDENTGNIYVSGVATPVLTTGNYTILGANDTVINNYNGEHSMFKSKTNIVACYDTNGNYKWYNCPLAVGCNIGSLAKYNDKLYAGVQWGQNLICGDSVYYPSGHISGPSQNVGYGIFKWNLQGNMTDVRQIYCTGRTGTAPYDTRITSYGDIYTAGRFDNIIAFGNDTLGAYSESDMFIAKFGLPCPTYIYDTATYCYGDVVQGVNLTASGDYTFVYPEGGQEIDSIVLIHATVLPPLTIGLNDTTVCTAQQFYLDACGDFDSYLWSTGGTGCTEMLQFDNACTQSVTLTVTRGECSATRTISITAQVCDGITEPTATAMSLYPNPATDMVTIFGDGFVSATVIDLTGRILLQTTSMQLDLSALRPGEYIIKVTRITGEVEDLKLVKE